MNLNRIFRDYGWLLPAVSIFWCIIFKFMPHGFRDLGGDSAQYIILAEGINQGKPLRMLNYPGEPFCFYYPPLFSFLLSPITYFFGRSFYLMHVLISILGFLSLFFFYHIFKRYADKKIALFSVLLLGFNWSFIVYCANYILSDIPYLFFSGFAIFMGIRYAEKASFWNREGFLLIFGLLSAYFIRYAGLTLFAGVFASLFLKSGGNKFGKIFLISAVFLFIYTAWGLLQSLNVTIIPYYLKHLFLIDPYAPYKGSLLAHPLYFAIRFIDGVNYYCRLMGDAIFADIFSKRVFLREALCIAAIFFTLTGLWFKFREDKGCVFHFYFLFYFTLVIFYSFREGVRFLLPILPFIFFYFLSGLEKVLRLAVKKSYFLFPGVFVPVIFALNILYLPRVHEHFSKNFPAEMANFISVNEWIKKSLPADSVIVSRKPTITYFYANRKAIIYPYSIDPEEIWKAIGRDGAGYIVVDEFSEETYNYLLPFLYKYNNRLKLLKKVGNTGLFEVL